MDAQLLLYVAPEQFESCTKFYEDVFEFTSFYGWDEGPEDRGCKYKLGGMVLVVLAQEKPFADDAIYPENLLKASDNIFPSSICSALVIAFCVSRSSKL